MNPILVSFLPLLGAAIGATLQYFFSRSTEAKKQLQVLRNQAYVDYLRAVAQAAHLLTPDDLVKARLLAADAKSRIVVYGDPAVIRALARFEEAGPRLDREPSREAFLQLAVTMRAEKATADQRSIELLLVGSPERRTARLPPGPAGSSNAQRQTGDRIATTTSDSPDLKEEDEDNAPRNASTAKTAG